MDEQEIIKKIIENGDVLDKLLFGVAIYVFRSFGAKLDKVADAVVKIDKHIAIIFERGDRDEKRISENEKRLALLGERYQSLINDHVSKIELNQMRIKTLEEKIKG